MTTAIFGLVGVIVGGLLSFGVELIVEKRKRDAEVFKAKRLVGEELQTIWIHLDSLLAYGKAPKQSEERVGLFMPTAVWATYRGTLAEKGALSDDEWRGMASVLHSVETLRRVILEHPPGSPLPADLLSDIRAEREFVADKYESVEGEPIGLDPSG